MEYQFARVSDARLTRVVAEIDAIASLAKRLVPSLANFLKRSIVDAYFHTKPLKLGCFSDTNHLLHL